MCSPVALRVTVGKWCCVPTASPSPGTVSRRCPPPLSPLVSVRSTCASSRPNRYVYYRRDLWNDPTEKKDFQKKYGYPLAPPKTWDQYLDQARFFNRPPHLHGTAFYGQRSFSYAWWANIWAGLGGHWFDAKTMKTQINSPAGLKALKYLLEMKKVSPPDVLSYGYDALRNAFFLGRFAMCVQWGDLHKKSFG